MFTKTVSYTYDAVGNRITMTYPDGETTTYEYDVVNQLVRVTAFDGVTTYEYDNAGRRTRMDYPNGVYLTYEYDANGRAVSLVARDASNAIIVNRAYEYDAVGNKLKETRDEDGSRREIEYDALDRLVQVTYHSSPAEVQGYTYDAVGNRLTKTVDGEVTTYTFDADDRLIKEEAPTETITYVNDNNGNRISKTNSTGTYSHEYDFENRLTKFTKPSGEYVSDQYSPQGLKLSRWWGCWGYSTYYLRSGRDVIEERSEAGEVYCRYNPGISAVQDPGTEYELWVYPLYDSFGTSVAEIWPDETHMVDFDEFGIKREGSLDLLTLFLRSVWDYLAELYENGYDPFTDTNTRRATYFSAIYIKLLVLYMSGLL